MAVSKPSRYGDSAVRKSDRLRNYPENEDFGSKEPEFRSGYFPKTVARIPDCGERKRVRPVIEPCVEPAAESAVLFPWYRRGSFWFRSGSFAAFWICGLLVGMISMRIETNRSSRVADSAKNDGEYVVTEIEPDDIPAVSETDSVPVFDAVRTAEIPQWNSETFEAIDSIPPWRPETELSRTEPSEKEPFTDSFDRTGAEYSFDSPVPEPESSFTSADSERSGVQAVAEPAIPERTDLYTAAKPEIEESIPEIPQEFASASDRPMKNSVEYFAPFATGEEEKNDAAAPTVRVAASDEFYEDAYDYGQFSGYVPPQRPSAGRTER